MKLKQVILNFVMFLAIALIGTGAMGCNAKASSARTVYAALVYAALKKEKGLADAKQWMVIKEYKHDYLVLASRTNAKQFRKDKAKVVNIIEKSNADKNVPNSADYDMYYVKAKKDKTHVKAVNVDPNEEKQLSLNPDANTMAANSVQIYNSLKEVAKVIE